MEQQILRKVYFIILPVLNLAVSDCNCYRSRKSCLCGEIKTVAATEELGMMAKKKKTVLTEVWIITEYTLVRIYLNCPLKN